MSVGKLLLFLALLLVVVSPVSSFQLPEECFDVDLALARFGEDYPFFCQHEVSFADIEVLFYEDLVFLNPELFEDEVFRDGDSVVNASEQSSPVDPDPQRPRPVQPPLEQTTASTSSFQFIYLFSGLTFLVIIILVLLHTRKRNFSQLKQYIMYYRQQGYSDIQIAYTLREQKYSEQFIQKVFKSLDE